MAKLKLSFEEIENEIDFEKLEQEMTTQAGPDEEMVSEIESQEVELNDESEETTEEDIVDAAEALESFSITLENNFKEDERVSDTVETLIAVKDKVESGELTDKGSVDLISDMATAGTDIESESFISTESFAENKNVALENIGNRIATAIANIANGVKETALAILPMYRNLFTFINLQKRKLVELKTKLGGLKSKSNKVSFELKANRYMVSGTNMTVASNKDEYFQTVKKNTEAFSEINTAVVAFTKSRFLTKTKTFLSMFVPGVGYNKNFLELYSSLNNELLIPLSKIKGLKVFQSENGFKEYVSDPYLGGYVLTVRVPEVAIPKNTDELSQSVKKLISVVPKATASFTNTDTVASFANYGTLKLENVSVSDIEKLVADSEKLADEASKHMTFIMKWVGNFSSGSLFAKLSEPLVGIALTQMFSGIRIVRLGSYIVHNVTNRIFQAMKGVTANNIKIATVAIGAFAAADK